MEFGEKLAKARKTKGMTQSALAEAVGVSTEAVSKWERGDYKPTPEKIELLERIIALDLLDADGRERTPRLFNEEHMSAFLKGKLNAGNYPDAQAALRFAGEKHAGQVRKGAGAVPYINHPLTMACHAFALRLEDDALIAALLLHDVPEDCGISPEMLPVSKEPQALVALVTKEKQGFSERLYYERISQVPKACLIKCIDRCNNLSTMGSAFSKDKVAEYARETETYYPALLRVIKDRPEFNNAAFLLEYQIRSLLMLARRIGG
jgi:GTP pyrophosphokinase